MNKLYRILIAVSLTAGLITAPVYAENTVNSNKYTIGPGYIMGVEDGCTSDELIAGIESTGTVYVNAIDENNIQNGDVLNADGEDYVIYTDGFKYQYIINDDFADGDLGEWTRTGGDVEKFAVSETEEYGNALTVTGTGTVTGRRNVSVGDAPAVIIEEMNLRFTKFNNDQVGIIVKNASDKYLSVMRLMNNGLYSLDPDGYYTLKGSVSENTWYNIKNITRTSDGIISTYINGVCVAENKKTQAIKNSPGDYIPTSVNLNVNSMTTEDAGLQIADYKMYSADTLKINKIEYISDGETFLDLRSVPTNMPQMKIYFATDGGKINAESVENGIKIIDEYENEIASETVFDKLTGTCTVTPKALLRNDAVYSLKAENITDSVSGFKFSGTYNFKTNSESIPFVLASAKAKSGSDIYDDISTIRKDTDTITLYFICREDTDINTEDIDKHFNFTDNNGNKVNYGGAYDAANHSYTFTLKNELVSGKDYKITIDGLADTADAKEYNKEINIKAVGSTTVDSEIYTVGNGYILGVKDGMAQDKFFSEITCLGTPVIYEGDTDNIRVGGICNGDTLSVADKKYKIETDIYPNDDIFYDTFNNGESGAWSKSAMMSVVTDDELGKVLSWTGDGATESSKKNFTSSRSISVGTLPSMLIFEYDMKFPVFNSTQIGLIMKNSAGKYLATVRMFPEGGEYKFKTLYTGGYKELLSGVKEDKNYHFKFVMDTATGLCDIYIDGKLVSESTEMQAITNSPGNYTPTTIEISGQNISRDGITLMMDNIELYSPTTIRTASITYKNGDFESGVLESVPVDIDSIKVKLSSDNALEQNSGSVSLADSDGNTVECDISANMSDLSYTLRPKCILKSNAAYKIVISDMVDSKYKIPYGKSYEFTTKAKSASAKIYSLTAKSGDKEYNDVSNIRTDTEQIEIRFIFQNDINVTAENVLNAIALYVGDDKVETDNTYDETNGLFTMRLLSYLTSGETYKLVIDDLKDTDGNVVLSRNVSMRAAAAWMVETGDILYSDVYGVSSGEISGIAYGTRVAQLWDELHTLPGTDAVIYENSDLQTVNTGILSDENVIEAYNSFTGDTKVYKLSFKGLAVESDTYNVNDGLIFGVENGISTDDFVANLNIIGADSYEITDADGNAASQISNGAELKLTRGSQIETYKIETLDTEDTVYFMSDFEDGTLNGWSGGTISDDGDHGKVLSGIISGASVDAKKSFSAKKELNINDDPEILVFETDVKVPVLPKSTIGILVRNSKDKYLSVFRIDQKETFYTLIPNAQSTLQDNMQANKWYHVTYVNNCKSGETDIYLDGKIVGEGLKFQATENFIPATINMSVDNTSSNGCVLSVDNMTMYAPNPIKTAYVEIVNGEIKTRDLTRVPVDTDEINVSLTVKDGYAVKNNARDCVSIVAPDGTTVPTTNTYDHSTNTVKLIPNEILECNEEYSIVINGITDDVYSKSFNDEIKFKTDGYDVKAANMFIMNDSGEMQDEFTFERLSVYVPVINYGGKKTVTYMLALYDENGRLVTCVSKDTGNEEAAINEVVFKINMSGYTTKAVTAKIYSREKDGGPLSEPFVVNTAK